MPAVPYSNARIIRADTVMWHKEGTAPNFSSTFDETKSASVDMVVSNGEHLVQLK